MTILLEIREKFEKAGWRTVLSDAGVWSRLVVFGDDDNELIYVDEDPVEDFSLKVHILHEALFYIPSELQSALDVVYGPEAFKIESDRLYFHEALIPLHQGDDICVVLPYPMDKVWTIPAPKMEVTIVPELCECCEAPDEPVVRCDEKGCIRSVCIDCMDHTHHKAMILPWIDTDHYGMDGEHITFCRWGRLFEDGYPNGNRIIGKTSIGNRWLVSTVWLGLDHSFGHGPPLIFETMVFRPGKWSEHECIRHATLKEAQEAHEATVRRWRWKLPYFVFAYEFLERKVIWKLEWWWKRHQRRSAK